MNTLLALHNDISPPNSFPYISQDKASTDYSILCRTTVLDSTDFDIHSTIFGNSRPTQVNKVLHCLKHIPTACLVGLLKSPSQNTIGNMRCNSGTPPPLRYTTSYTNWRTKHNHSHTWQGQNIHIHTHPRLLQMDTGWGAVRRWIE